MERVFKKPENYRISLLTDFSRLREIYALNHDALIEVGDIAPTDNGMLIINSRLDQRPETSILIAEQDGEIIGTISFTLDGKEGMHLERWFKPEVEQIRKSLQGKLGAAWRFAIGRNYRNNRQLVLDLVRAAFAAGREQACSQCLIVSTYRHIRFYQTFMEAEVIAERKASLDGDRWVDIALLKIDVEKIWKKL